MFSIIAELTVAITGEWSEESRGVDLDISRRDIFSYEEVK